MPTQEVDAGKHHDVVDDVLHGLLAAEVVVLSGGDRGRRHVGDDLVVGVTAFCLADHRLVVRRDEDLAWDSSMLGKKKTRTFFISFWDVYVFRGTI